MIFSGILFIIEVFLGAYRYLRPMGAGSLDFMIRACGLLVCSSVLGEMGGGGAQVFGGSSLAQDMFEGRGKAKQKRGG